MLRNTNELLHSYERRHGNTKRYRATQTMPQSISRRLAYVLRHGATKEKIPIDQEGFVSYEDLVRR
jgi:RNA:NAD 2'-phosphotransferase (TPT1/KptA family)